MISGDARVRVGKARSDSILFVTCLSNAALIASGKHLANCKTIEFNCVRGIGF